MIDTLKSIAIYLGVFGLSFFLFRINEQELLSKICNSKSPSYKRAVSTLWENRWALLGILLLSTLAGLRADSVGVDVTVYPDAFLHSAVGYKFFLDFLNDPVVQPIFEPLHALVVWLCSRVTVEKGLLLFCYQLLTVTPVYCALYQLRNHAPISMGMAVYMLFFYNNSLNMMRQSVSCAFLLLAFSIFLARQGKPSWEAVVSAAVAVLFHRSGIYGLILLLCASPLGLARRRWVRPVAYLAIAFAPLLLVCALQLFEAGGFNDPHIEYYYNVFIAKSVNADWFINPMKFSSIAYIVMYSWLIFLPKFLPVLLGKDGVLLRLFDSCFLFGGRGQYEGAHFANGIRTASRFRRSRQAAKQSSDMANESKRLSVYLHNLNIVGYILYIAILFALQTVYGIRISLYFDFFLIPSISLACSGDNARDKKILVLISLVCIWLVWIIRLGWSGSQTYLFFFE